MTIESFQTIVKEQIYDGLFPSFDAGFQTNLSYQKNKTNENKELKMP